MAGSKEAARVDAATRLDGERLTLQDCIYATILATAYMPLKVVQ